MENFTQISIIGLGLIGGSLAKALRRKFPQSRIVGFDTNNGFSAKALEESVLSCAASSIEETVRDSDLIFLCTPVNAIEKLLLEISKFAKDGAIITDTASTKQNIDLMANSIIPKNICFIGGHPMTGTEQSGYNNSLPHLFENAYYILTPTSKALQNKLESLEFLIASIGAIPIVMEPAMHDYVVGGVSHLPHIVASSLVNAVSKMNDSELYRLKLAAGGFKDITRIASSNPAMWTEITLANKIHLSDLIRSVVMELELFQNSLIANSYDQINTFFSDAKKFRDDLKGTQSIAKYYELYVDIVDKPGQVAAVTSILAENNVNIKNLRIIHNREDEPAGCMVISLSDTSSLAVSMKVLTDKGFSCYGR